jgi:hypothetical protein
MIEVAVIEICLEMSLKAGIEARLMLQDQPAMLSIS